MSTLSMTRGRPVGVIALAVAVCIALPLIVSSQQAGRFFESLGSGIDATILFATACAIIFASPTIAVLSGHVAGHWLRVAAILTCLAIAFFSVTTTTIAIHTKTSDKINSEAQLSATGRSLQNAIIQNQNTIQSLQAQIDARDPVRWASKRGEWANQIQALQMQNMQLLRQQEEHRENGSGSSTGETFARLEEWGITRFGFAVFGAFLLDLIPLIASLIIGQILANSRMVQGWVQAGTHNRYKDDELNQYRESRGKKYQPPRAA